MTATQKLTQGLRTVATDIAQGFFEITHNGFALLGLAVMFAVLTLTAKPEIRQAGTGHPEPLRTDRSAIQGRARSIARPAAVDPPLLA